jgi:CheY-like chemotaxis protein
LDARALVVDDSRTVRVRVRRLLEGTEDFNFEVSEAADGSEALKLLEKTAIDRLPDVILLDRNMPRVSGDACIRILKSDPVWKTIPVIFLTAQADKAEVVRGLSLLLRRLPAKAIRCWRDVGAGEIPDAAEDGRGRRTHLDSES